MAGFVAGHGWVMALLAVSSLQLNEITFLCLFTPDVTLQMQNYRSIVVLFLDCE